MQIELNIDENCRQPKVVIYASKVTDEIENLLRKLSDTQNQPLVGFQNESLEILQPEEIIRIYSENQRVYAQTGEACYLLRLRLYEVEEGIGSTNFIRISNSEIINLKKVKNMDLSISGTICVNLYGGIRTFVSRRYVAKIKSKLGI